MKIQSTRFGELEVGETEIINFAHGIPGFIDEKMFVYLLHDQESPFSFLQSVKNPDLTFLLADPFAFFNDYEFVLEDQVAQDLGVSREEPPQVFLIATVKEKLEDITVNLLAPLIINGKIRVGRQIILDKSDYSTRHRLFPDGLPKEPAKGGK